MPVTALEIVNQAVNYMGNNQPPVTGSAPNFDSSTIGQAAKSLYVPCVQTVAKQFGWDFARRSFTLVLSGNTAPFPYAFEYLYPSNGIEVWQLFPAALADANNPIPVNWTVANADVTGVQKKVIQTNLAAALCVYNNVPTEDTWDAAFREAVARLLASEFAMAGAGKPDVAQGMLQSGSAFESIGETRNG